MRARIVDIAGVGLNATDTLIELSRFPASGSKMPLLSLRTLPGGQTATAIVACAKWGLRTRYVGRIGDDADGRMHREELGRAGVESHLIRVRDCPSPQSFILVERQSGERTILWKRDPRLALRRGDLRRGWITSARLLQVDGHDAGAAAVAARWARSAGVPVSADLDTVYPGLPRLLRFVDYPVTSREFPMRLTGEKDPLRGLPRLFARYRFRLVCCTIGRDGALAWDGTRFWYAPSYRVRAVDTTGAGDLFHAGFAFGVLKSWDWQRVLEFSCAAAALNCTALGARGGIRPLREIELLRTAGRRNPPAFSARELAQAARARQEHRGHR
jgi:sulfofructose kinase